MAAPRASWKGFLKLSLVSCPVRLHTATTRQDRVSFNYLNRKTGSRINMRPFDPESGEIDRAELVRGYEFEKGRYVTVEDAELERLQVESSKTIELERFVDRSEVDPLYLDTPYYVAPDGPVAQEAFRVIREAMARQSKAALGRVTLSSREHPVMLEPRGRGMSLVTLRASNEVRAAEAYFEDIKDTPIAPDMLELAEHIIQQKSGPFDPAMFEDRYQAALLDLVRSKVRGEEPVVPRIAPQGKVIDLMEALRRSVADEQGERKPSRRRPAAPPAAAEAAPAVAASKPRRRKSS